MTAIAAYANSDKPTFDKCVAMINADIREQDQAERLAKESHENAT
jgi:hypothetical protein